MRGAKRTFAEHVMRPDSNSTLRSRMFDSRPSVLSKLTPKRAAIQIHTTGISKRHVILTSLRFQETLHELRFLPFSQNTESTTFFRGLAVTRRLLFFFPSTCSACLSGLQCSIVLWGLIFRAFLLHIFVSPLTCPCLLSSAVRCVVSRFWALAAKSAEPTRRRGHPATNQHNGQPVIYPASAI